VAHPLLQGPHRHARSGHGRAERVAQVVEAVRLIELGCLGRSSVATHESATRQHGARGGLSEHEGTVGAPAGRLVPSIELGSRKARDTTDARASNSTVSGPSPYGPRRHLEDGRNLLRGQQPR